jgi:hypothetical protein
MKEQSKFYLDAAGENIVKEDFCGMVHMMHGTTKRQSHQ